MHTFLLALALHTLPAHAAEVVVFGDSWAEGSGDELEDALRAAGLAYDVANYGVGGTTAAYWNATAPDALSDAVAANPDARWVWLSILGNDTFAHHAERRGAQCASENEAELRAMLDRLHAAAPDVQVVSFAYDFPNFEQSAECILSAALYFPAMVDAGTFSTLSINQVFDRDIAQVQARVDADHPRFEAYTQWGLLQRDAGATSVNQALPSPGTRMADCIHPTSQGYRALHDGLVDLYWRQPAPVGAITGAPTAPVCVGTTVQLTDGSVGGTERLWWVDGVERTGSPVLDLVVTAGTTPVRLRTYAGAWHDDVDVDLVGVDVPVASASGGGRVCAGESVTLHASGEGDVTWSPSAGLDDATSPDPVASPAVTTTYVATVSSAADCDDTATVEVVVLPAPVLAVAGPDATAPGVDVTFTLAAVDVIDVVWSVPGAAVTANGLSATVRFADPGPYTVTVTAASADGCEGVATAQIAVIADVVTEEPETGSGCGCRTGGGAGAWWMVVLGALGWRRRRHPAA